MNPDMMNDGGMLNDLDMETLVMRFRRMEEERMRQRKERERARESMQNFQREWNATTFRRGGRLGFWNSSLDFAPSTDSGRVGDTAGVDSRLPNVGQDGLAN